jgi:hypothetical protein
MKMRTASKNSASLKHSLPLSTNLKEKKKSFSFFSFVEGSGGGLSRCCLEIIA